jgi:aquaporin Z
VGGSVAGLFSWSALWIYLVAQLVAGALAGLVFLALNPHERVVRPAGSGADADAVPGADAAADTGAVPGAQAPGTRPAAS